MTGKDVLISWLNDAHGMETSLIQILEHQVKDAEGQPMVQQKLQQHLAQTREHAEIVKGCVERLQGYLETNFEPGRRFANHLDFQLQLDQWFEKANARTHKTLRARPIDRLVEEREVMRWLPDRVPDLDRRWVVRVPPDPHLRLDTNDYSLDPNLVGRRVEVRVSQREVIAVALDSGELACHHERCFAKNRTITALEHARALRDRRGQRDEVVVQRRPLSVYDQLIA